jgi:glutamate-5-semialdehyde dehydrogenase
MAELLAEEKECVLAANRTDMGKFDPSDRAMYDRLKVDEAKIDSMIDSVEQLADLEDPLGVERYSFTHENGLKIFNKTAAFGTVLIIYESRPDVTVEAAGIAFKSGNRILLKGGKESLSSNLAIVKLWHKALSEMELSTDWVTYLNLNREETQAFLKDPSQKVDLIVPRGGEGLIAFVKQHASCPVVVSGRGNNFAFVHKDADQELALQVILNAKMDKVSACNALDKVLIDRNLPGLSSFLEKLTGALHENGVEIKVFEELKELHQTELVKDADIWAEEFLDYKILIGLVDDLAQAKDMINQYGGGHSATILTSDEDLASEFMQNVDAAAVYHNASTRFTDGFQFGLGGELAISTDKLHQRGPIGLQHLVTNKWYVYGKGQVR